MNTYVCVCVCAIHAKLAEFKYTRTCTSVHVCAKAPTLQAVVVVQLCPASCLSSLAHFHFDNQNRPILSPSFPNYLLLTAVEQLCNYNAQRNERSLRSSKRILTLDESQRPSTANGMCIRQHEAWHSNLLMLQSFHTIYSALVSFFEHIMHIIRREGKA